MSPEEKQSNDILIKDLQDTIKELMNWKAEQLLLLEESVIIYSDLSREASEYRNDLTKIKSLNILVFLDRMQHDIDRDNLNKGFKGRQAGHQIIGLDHLREELEKLGLKHDENEVKWKKERNGL